MLQRKSREALYTDRVYLRQMPLLLNSASVPEIDDILPARPTPSENHTIAYDEEDMP